MGSSEQDLPGAERMTVRSLSVEQSSNTSNTTSCDILFTGGCRPEVLSLIAPTFK